MYRDHINNSRMPDIDPCSFCSPVVGGGVARVLEVGPIHRGGRPAGHRHQAAHPKPIENDSYFLSLSRSVLTHPEAQVPEAEPPRAEHSLLE